jgi:hypothetical protein
LIIIGKIKKGCLGGPFFDFFTLEGRKTTFLLHITITKVGPTPESFMSGLDRLLSPILNFIASSGSTCEGFRTAPSSPPASFHSAFLLSEINRAWENLSLAGSRVHHLLRDQISNGDETISEHLDSWGEPGEVIRTGSLLVFLEQNPALTVDQFHWIGRLPQPFRDQFWQRALAVLENRGVEFNREEMGSYDQFIGLLHRNGITYDGRAHSLETALHLLHQRRHLSDAGRDRPLAVVIVNIDDYNGAFEAPFLIDDFSRSGRYDVVYLEACSDRQAREALGSLYQTTGGRRIEALVLGGHGSRTSLQLGKTGSCGSGDPDAPWIDVADLENGEWRSLDTYLSPTAHVILWACSNGAPEEAPPAQNLRIPNLADEFASALPGRTIHATETPNNIAGITFTSVGIPVITWQDDTAHVVRSSCGEAAKAVADTSDRGLVPRALLDWQEEVEHWVSSLA